MTEPSATHLDLDADIDGEEEMEPSCTFQLAGRTWSCRQSEDVPFDVVAALLGSGDERQALVKIEPFLRGVLFPDQAADFITLLHDPDSPVTLGRIQPLIQHVAEHVLGRPTKRPAPSRRGSLPKAPTSTAV